VSAKLFPLEDNTGASTKLMHTAFLVTEIGLSVRMKL